MRDEGRIFSYFRVKLAEGEMVSKRIKWLFKMLNIYKLFCEICEIYEFIDSDGGDR